MKSSSPKFSWEKYLIITVSACILVLGIRWGLPNENRVKLLLGEAPLTEDFVSALNFHHSKGKDHLSRHGEPREDERIVGLRSFIGSGAAADEPMLYSALARMNPGQLDLNPRGFFSYGGSYVYVVGAVIFFLKSIGACQITNDLYYYLQHPSHVALIYIAGRVINCIAFLGTLALLGKIGDKFGGRLCGTAAMLTLVFSTGVLDQTLVSKPHIYATFWVLLSIFLTIRHSECGAWGYLVMSSIAAGWALGASMATWPVALSFPILLWNGCGKWDTFVKTVAAWGMLSLAFLLTNPYALITFDQFLPAIMKERQASIGLSGFRILGSFKDMSLQAYSFPLGIVGLVTMVQVLVTGPAMLQRMAILGTSFILFSVPLAGTRHFLFVGPLLCFFAGYGTTRFLHCVPNLRKPLKAVILVLLFLPGAIFTLMLARDVILDQNWNEQVQEWARTMRIEGEPSVGIFFGMYGGLMPLKMPPFPFVRANIVNMDSDKLDGRPPEYVLISSYCLDRQPERWAAHPLRPKYSLAYALGFRESYNWFLNFRVQSQSCIAGWVYRRLDP
jgi:hypothetical protein